MKGNAMKHFSLTELARKKALEDWGHNAESSKKAVEQATTESIQEGALLELVRRLNQVIKAWSNDKDVEDNQISYNQRPKNAIVIDGLKVGDVCYACDLEDGVSRITVVQINKDGYAKGVFDQEQCEHGRVYLHWICDHWCSRTEQEAVLAAARSDVEYYKPRLEKAMKIIEAVEGGKPYEHLMKDVDE
jgi:hypothetical protein